MERGNVLVPLSVLVALEGGFVRRGEARPRLRAPVDLVGLGMKLDRHQAEALGTAQIETAPGDTEAVFGLAAKEFGDVDAKGSSA